MVVDTPFTPDSPALTRARSRLLARLRRQYDLLTDPIQVGPLTIPFTRVADPDRVLDEVAREEDRREKLTGRRKREDELHLPYWAELWESSIGIATYLVNQWAHCGAGESAVSRLAKRAAFSPDKPVRMIDLGCGMGLSGTAAARLGARVLFADLETPALLFARLNSLSSPGSRVRRVNWQTDRLDEQFDLILGADIVYDRSQWSFLEIFFQAHLAPDGVVLLGEPGRRSGEEFERWIRAKGWQLKRFTQSLPHRSFPIQLLELSAL